MVLPRLAPRQRMERAASVRLVVALETALERNLARTIVAIGRNAMSRYVAGGDPAAVDAVDMSTIGRVLAPSLRNTARVFGRALVSKSTDIGIETKAFEDLDAGVEEFLRAHTADRVVQISDALKRIITNIIRDGLEANRGVEEVAQAIVEATSGTMAMARARRIARTETHMAANAGQLAAARASPLQWRKEWLATEDQRTREDHAEANGQTVDLDEPFIVGGEEMMMPGDPNAPPEQTINCRCAVLYSPIAAVQRPDDDEAGGVELNDLLTDPDLWRAFFQQLEERNALPADVVLYATGEACGLPQFASADDIEIGSELVTPRSASMNPILVNAGAGLPDTFPLYGRPVVVKIAAPAGTPAESGATIAMEVKLREDVRIVVTAVTEERWGEAQDEAGVERDRPRARYRHQRMPARRGITLVEAEVQTK